MRLISRRHQMPFGIRFLLLGTLSIVLGTIWLQNETDGRLVLNGEQPYPNAAVIHAFEPQHIASLKESLEAALVRHASKHGIATPCFELKEVEVDGYRFLRVDHDRWTRRRLDLRRFDYITDDTDPVAELYNQQLNKTIDSVAYQSYNFAGQ